VNAGHSEHHDAAPIRQSPGREGRQDLPAVEREPLAERLPMQGEGASIRTGVGHDQDDRVDAAVALLEGYPPLERLDVPECCFRLACGDTSILRCDAVSGAAVPGQRKRNLGAPDGPVRQAGRAGAYGARLVAMRPIRNNRSGP